jgi:hypothetical protein
MARIIGRSTLEVNRTTLCRAVEFWLNDMVLRSYDQKMMYVLDVNITRSGRVLIEFEPPPAKPEELRRAVDEEAV